VVSYLIPWALQGNEIEIDDKIIRNDENNRKLSMNYLSILGLN
jgi:hypothetical protein